MHAFLVKNCSFFTRHLHTLFRRRSKAQSYTFSWTLECLFPWTQMIALNATGQNCEHASENNQMLVRLWKCWHQWAHCSIPACNGAGATVIATYQVGHSQKVEQGHQNIMDPVCATKSHISLCNMIQSCMPLCNVLCNRTRMHMHTHKKGTMVQKM